MAAYDDTGTIAPAATKTPLIIGGSATVRPQLWELMLATIGVPSSEASFQVFVRAATALGTSTAVTPRPKNAISVAGHTAGSNASVEPTYAAGQPLLSRQGNPRNMLVWQALQELAALQGAAASANGFGAQIQIAGGALTSVDCDMTVVE